MSFVAYGAFKKERSFFMKKISEFFKAIGRYFKNFGVAFAKVIYGLSSRRLSWVQVTSQESRSSMA